MMLIGFVTLCVRKALNLASRQGVAETSKSNMTKHSTNSGTKLRTCLPNLKTGVVLQHVTTDVLILSRPPLQSLLSSYGGFNES